MMERHGGVMAFAWRLLGVVMGDRRSSNKHRLAFAWRRDGPIGGGITGLFILFASVFDVILTSK